jgi:hypothetical protein
MVKPVEFAEYFAPTPIPFWTTLQQVGVTKVISELNRLPTACTTTPAIARGT